MHYLRYNAILNSSWSGKLGILITEKQAKSLAIMDDAGNVELLKTIGEKAGMDQVTAGYFPTCFDLQ